MKFDEVFERVLFDKAEDQTYLVEAAYRLADKREEYSREVNNFSQALVALKDFRRLFRNAVKPPKDPA